MVSHRLPRDSNPSFKGPGLQTKKRLGPVFQGNTVTDVHVTVPAVKKTANNTNSTNQMRDAREKLVVKTKPQDARDRLNQKAQGTDARQKLMNIRAQKDPVPVDARAKILGKKQLVTGPQPQAANFSLTRTVSNAAAGSVQVNPGPQGQLKITKTLTKVMPPGYEDVTGVRRQAAVTHRLGPPAGSVPDIHNIANITRTVSNPQASVPVLHGQPSTYLPPQSTYNPPYPPYAPPAHYPAPVSHMSAPPPQQNFYPQSPAHPPPQPYSHTHIPASSHSLPYPPQEQSGPGYQVHVPHQSPVIPKIQVHNDHYQPPAVAPVYPVQPHYAPPPGHAPYAAPAQPEYGYVQQSQPVYYQPPFKQEIQYQSEEQSLDEAQYSMARDNFSVKTIVNNPPPPPPAIRPTIQSSTLKRKSQGEVIPVISGQGALRSSNTNYVPIIEPSSADAAKKGKFTKIAAPGVLLSKSAREKSIEEEEENVISPIQGFRISITNLAVTVTQDDIIELFGAVGGVKSVKLVKKGQAEVVYVKKEDAIQATQTYHERELDGLPMIVKNMTPVSARVKEVAEKPLTTAKGAEGKPLIFNKKAPVTKDPSKIVDVGTLHKALFKTGTTVSSKPVTFTVNI
ncbi:arginine-glutamic acid dipeptide repeats protein-like isoform X2 [Dreissena polymorpha]|uniref:arginine-glutamic acid dipeptide repeats protein-like isoform X2 n=1 Tax=Dreissena polymorpha TaxID=45954 RepID=UPI002264B253|nr:arginine-glutamic acid dipeptide repeats protein-like isoform X2 [Dreissena polymorpha]